MRAAGGPAGRGDAAGRHGAGGPSPWTHLGRAPGPGGTPRARRAEATATRRVGELVGALGFVPAAGKSPAGPVAGIHPERVAPGPRPGDGLVMTGTVEAIRPAGAGWEAELRVADAAVTCHLPDRPAAAGSELVVTALDPPWFGPDGAAVIRPPRGEQVGA